MIDRVASAHTLEGLVVDPSSGSYPGRVTIDDGSIVSVDRRDDASPERLLLPGFIDL